MVLKGNFLGKLSLKENYHDGVQAKRNETYIPILPPRARFEGISKDLGICLCLFVNDRCKIFYRLCLSSAKPYFFNKSGKFVRKTKLVRGVFPKVMVLEHKKVDFNPLDHFIMKRVDEKRRKNGKPLGRLQHLSIFISKSVSLWQIYNFTTVIH